MSAMKRLEETIMSAPMADLAFIFQRRLLEQDAINTINHETLASIANSIDCELINRLAPCEEYHE